MFNAQILLQQQMKPKSSVQMNLFLHTTLPPQKLRPSIVTNVGIAKTELGLHTIKSESNMTKINRNLETMNTRIHSCYQCEARIHLVCVK